MKNLLLITSVLMILIANIVSTDLGKKFCALGVKVIIDEVKMTGAKIGESLLSGLVTGIRIYSGASVIFIGGSMVALALTAIISYRALTGNIDGSKFFLELPQMTIERVTASRKEVEAVSYVDFPVNNPPPRIWIESNPKRSIYGVESLDYKGCKIVVITSDKKIGVTIKKDCLESKSFVPLKQRTKTLADLKTGDSTEILQQADKLIKKYEKNNEKKLNSDSCESQENYSTKLESSREREKKIKYYTDVNFF